MKSKLVKFLSIIIVIVLLLILIYNIDLRSDNVEEKGLQITGLTTSIGAINQDNINLQRLSFTAVLNNYNDQTIFIEKVVPVLGKKFSKKIVNTNLDIQINKNIESQGNVVIKGELIFDMKGMSKEDFNKSYKETIKGFEIVTKQKVLLNKYKEK